MTSLGPDDGSTAGAFARWRYRRRLRQATPWVRDFLAALPPEVRDELAERGVRVILPRVPSPALLAHGVGPTWRGAYLEGVAAPYDEDPDASEAGPRLAILFLGNIAPWSREEVCRVLAHELAHALGADEEQVFSLGLGV